MGQKCNRVPRKNLSVKTRIFYMIKAAFEISKKMTEPTKNEKADYVGRRC